MGDYDPDNDANRKVVCPFDPHHTLLRKRLGNHISKCFKNHPEYKRCPFNAQHYIKEEDFMEHLDHCTNRAGVDRFLVDGVSEDQGNCEAPPVEDSDFSSRPPSSVHSSHHWQNEEFWDDDDDDDDIINNSQRMTKFQPQPTIFTKTQGWKPAQKKKYYENLCNRKSMKGEGKEEDTHLQPLPPPVNNAQNIVEDPELQAIVMGRGQAPPAAPQVKKSRIGARFPGAGEPLPQPSIVAQPAPNLLQRSGLIQRTAIGRGRGCNPTQERPSTLTQAFQQVSLNGPPTNDLN